MVLGTHVWNPGNAIYLNADVAAGASRTRSHDKGVRGVVSCGQTMFSLWFPFANGS